MTLKKTAARFFLTVVCLGLSLALPAPAASLQLVSNNWGTNGVPSTVSMYVYVPDKLATNPPVLVVVHYCGGSAAGVFGEAYGGGIVAAADLYGFIMIFPQAVNPDGSGRCWDVGSTSALTRNGGGDTEAIAQMVKYALTNYQANSNQVYVTGTSSGAMMTEALLALYPDVFKAGAEFSGVPAGAWAVDDPTGGWSGPAAAGQVTHTPQDWGTIARAMDPGYSGSRPRVQLWHGMADGTINYNNQIEAIKQWTDVLGLSTNATFSTTVTFASHQWTHQIWPGSSGAPALDAWSEYNGPHGTDANLNAAYVIPFMGLDGVNLSFPWLSQDVGSVGVNGGASLSNGVFTVTGSGGDIWNTADAFQFVYVPVTGNATIVARVPSVQNTDPWSKAGVMIRESLAANAANALIAVTPGNGVTWQTRSGTGGATVNTPAAGLTAPYWVKLVRSGNTFTGYRSPDGVTWTPQGTATFAMASTAFIGLALTSHNNALSCTAAFDNVTAPGWLLAQGLVPGGLSATAVPTGQINLVCNALTNATAYNVKRSLTNGGPYAVVAGGVTATNHQDGGLAGGTSYYYVVSAVEAGGETPDSAQAAATTVSPTLGSLVHRHSFSETGGSNVADSVGGPVWTGTLPNGGTIGGGHLTLSAAAQQYVSLPPGIVSPLTNFTVLAWVNLTSSTNWSRIFDFGNNTTTNMYLTPQNGVTGTLRFAITTNGSGAEQQINCNSTLTTGVWHQVAVTLNGRTGVLSLDGAAVGTNSGLTITPASLGPGANDYLGKSQYADPCLNGSLDEFRIYNAGLSAAEIAATAALGPGQLLSTNRPPIGTVLAGPRQTFSWPLASAGYTLQSCTNLLSGGWLNVTSPGPQIISNQWQVTLSPGNAGPVFYRLVK